MQTLIRPRFLLRARLIPSILTGSSPIPLRKLHSGSRLQEKYTGPPQHKQRKQRVDKVFSMWKEFYSRARAIRDKGPMKHAKEEPVDLFNASDTMLNAVDEVFEKIEKKSLTTFPKVVIQRALASA